MNKDTQLIYETYIEEGRLRSAALAIMCALGFGCSSINQQPGERPDTATKGESTGDEWIDVLGLALEAWLTWLISGVSDEQKLHLGDSINQRPSIADNQTKEVSLPSTDT